MVLLTLLQESKYTQEDFEKFLKIKKILYKINQHFHEAEPDIGELKRTSDTDDFEWERNKNSSKPKTREEYLKENHPEIKLDSNEALDWSFSLSADEIIAQKIPMQAMGCTGIAKLFAKYAEQENLDCFAVFTAKMKKLEEKKINPEATVDGHQIIAVQFSDGARMFDPGSPYGLQFYKDNSGQEILVPSMKELYGKKLIAQNSEDPWAQRQAGSVVTRVEPASRLEYIKSYKDVENRYLIQQAYSNQKE